MEIPNKSYSKASFYGRFSVIAYKGWVTAACPHYRKTRGGVPGEFHPRVYAMAPWFASGSWRAGAGHAVSIATTLASSQFLSNPCEPR
jgi:hypothetical protein